MKNSRFAVLWVVVSILALGTAACGSRSLQAVSIAPASATSPAQFKAVGTFNQSPSSADITASTTWCIGSAEGVCAGDIAVNATVNAGMAACLPGATGTVTILAGQPGPPQNPDVGQVLKPYGSAQLNCD